MIRPPPRSTLFPSTLFRSLGPDHVTTVFNISSARNLARVPTAFAGTRDRKSTRLNSSHGSISYAVFCLKKKKEQDLDPRLEAVRKSGERHAQGQYARQRTR